MRKKMILTLSMMLVPALLLSGCYFTGKTDKLTYTGTVESEEYDVQTEIGGRVESIFVKEGQQVQVGQKVVKLQDQSLKLQVEQAEAAYQSSLAKYEDVKQGARKEEMNQAEAALAMTQAKLKDLEAGSRPERIEQQKAMLKAVIEKRDFAKKNYEYRKDTYEKYEKMQEEGNLPKQQLEDAKNLLDQAYMQLAAEEEDVNSAKAQLDLLQNGETQHALEAARANVAQARAQYDKVVSGPTASNLKSLYALAQQGKANVDLMKINLQKSEITTPITGTLLETYVKKGEVVAQGAVIATISDLNDLWVKIYVPEKYYDKISLGKNVLLSSDRMKEKIKGEVVYISSEAEFTPKNTETKENRENTVFEIKIKIKDHLKEVKPGMSLEIEI